MRIYAWLRMVPSGGSYPFPTSEASYMSNAGIIDVVYPANGGVLQPDGKWERSRADNEWSRSLPVLASEYGQQYVPSVTAGRDALTQILNEPELAEISADLLVQEALTGFDAPWGGVMYDIIDVDESLVRAHEEYVHLLSYKVRLAGVEFHTSVCGTVLDRPAYFGLKTLDQTSDIVVVYCYAWWVQPRCIGPYYWTKSSIERAIMYIPERKIVLGVGTFSTYWPLSGGQQRIDMPYDDAVQLVYESNGRIEWVEDTRHGLVRELRADLGDGHIWITDGATTRHRLDIAKANDLNGIMLFILGAESSYVWEVLTE